MTTQPPSNQISAVPIIGLAMLKRRLYRPLAIAVGRMSLSFLAVAIIIAGALFLRHGLCEDINFIYMLVLLLIEAILFIPETHKLIIKYTYIKDKYKIFSLLIATSLSVIIIWGIPLAFEQVCNGKGDVDLPFLVNQNPPIMASLKVQTLQSLSDVTTAYSDQAVCYPAAIDSDKRRYLITGFEYTRNITYEVKAKSFDQIWVLLETDAPYMMLTLGEPLNMLNPHCQIWIRTFYVVPPQDDWLSGLHTQDCPPQSCS